MSIRFFFFFPLSLMILLASCVMLPVPTQEDKVLAGKPVKDEQLSFINAKVTTKEEVIERLGNPNVIWEDARTFIYSWDMRQGILLWAAGAYYAGGMGKKDIPKHYLLLIQFDEKNTVLSFTRTKRPLSQRYADFLKDWLKNSSGLSSAEQKDVNVGEKAIVLLNVQCMVDNQPYESFVKPTFTTEPIFLFGLGSFKTIGEPRFVSHRFLSEESRRAGWTYFTLSPGTYYLAVLGPDTSVGSKSGGEYLQEAPRWRLDIPENVKAIYAGTLQFEGKTNGELLFGGKIIIPAGSDEPSIRDDHLLANALLSKHFPDAGDAKTILMKRWHPGDPVIIRSHKE